MSELQPASQEAEHIGPALTLKVTGWVVLFGCVLCVVAALTLAARSRSLPAAGGVQPARRAQPVRDQLFRLPAASERLKAAQRQRLSSYGWVDRPAGVVRIPIEDAIALEAQEATP